MSNLLRLIQTMKPRKKGKGWLCCAVLYMCLNYTNYSFDMEYTVHRLYSVLISRAPMNVQ